MKLNELAPPKGAKKKRKRIGRGEGSGHGGTACRGHKGQKSRSGGKVRRGFEGGQMPLQRRLPKRGFTNIFRKEYAILNIRDLERFEENSVITPDVLKEKGVIKKIGDGVKILGMGEIKKPLTVKVQKISKLAQKKIEAQGGKIEVI